MAENKNAAIQIGQLNLRIGAQSADAAHRVAAGVGEGLARIAPCGVQHQLGAVNVRVRVPAGATESEMSAAVADAIIKTVLR